MNHTRPVETVSDTQQRKSLRQRKPLEVNNSFFKKVYKPRNPQACQSNSSHKEPCTDSISIDPHLAMLRDAAVFLFQPVTSSSLQFKAIINYRIKKLKRLRNRKAAMSPKGHNPNLDSEKKSEFLQNRATLRSIQARLRHRDYRGKFLSSEKNHSDTNEATTVDMREVSTTRGSLLGQPMQIETLWHRSEALSHLDSEQNVSAAMHLTAAGGDPSSGDCERLRSGIEEYLNFIRVQRKDLTMAQERLFADSQDDALSEEPPQENPLEPQLFDHHEPFVSRKLDFSIEDHMEPFNLTENYFAEQFTADPFRDSTHPTSRSAFV
jgi:hypothetical protein